VEDVLLTAIKSPEFSKSVVGKILTPVPTEADNIVAEKNCPLVLLLLQMNHTAILSWVNPNPLIKLTAVSVAQLVVCPVVAVV
jgi:hypothetical protein